MAQIVFDHVTKMFEPEDLVLEEISFRIEKGEFVFLIGKSGVGKSSILKLLSRQEEASAGQIFVDERDISLIKKRELPYFRRKFGIMQADMRCLRDRNVYENLLLVMRSCGYSRRESKRRIIEALGRVGMAHKAAFYPQELSVGEEARVLLARALVTEPEILLADEPTANLDPDASWDMMNLINDVNHQGITVVVSSHSVELVNIMRKRVLTLVEGMLVSDEKNAGYSSKALDIFEERRIRQLREKKSEKI
ncbi:MAG: ATP-binding cassette domain-containing protein [Lachnospiraceae bacterium]|jgi:cell division transport system ATP-binding protein|nr:ATP-binding cassette domain-containing protein [Lachnospiraceae bacterium]